MPSRTSSSPASLPGNALALAQAVNMSAYSILASVREDRPYSLSPGGLTPGYNGHTFWDCETWMYPTIAVFHPDLAGSILQYRFNRMPGAKEKAKSYTPPYSGTMFPWESAFTGEEVCPSWAATGLREIHISGDIAFALNQYWSMTRDMEWLVGVGRPMFSNIAEFWLSKATPNPDGTLSINDVIPPDEYHDHVNNSAYTNSVARLSFEYAVMADHQVGLPPSASMRYSQAASQLVIPFDPKLMIHPEYDGYNGGTIKQADVILMGFPLDVNFGNMTPAVAKNDLLYYQNRTDPNGPAMTWAMQSIGLLQLGDTAGAASNFARGHADQQQPFLVWTETPSGGTPNFITGAGGFLQAVVFGYPGLRIRSSGLFWLPKLYPDVGNVKLVGVSYLGNRMDVEYDAKQVSFTVQPDSDVLVRGAALPKHGLAVLDIATGSTHPLVAGKAVSLSLSSQGFLVQKYPQV